MIPSARPVVRFAARALPAERAAVLTVLDPAPSEPAGVEPMAFEAGLDRVVADGADIVMVAGGGGDEIRRVAASVGLARGRYPDLVLGVATRRPEVARCALEAGADLLGEAGDPDDLRDPGPAALLAALAAEYGCAVTCPPSVHVAERLVALGVPTAGILLDASRGADAGATPGRELLRRGGELAATGWPVLMALSDRDFLGPAADSRPEAALAATAIAAWAGVGVFRVLPTQQVRPIRRVLEMVASIAGTRPPARAVRGLA